MGAAQRALGDQSGVGACPVPAFLWPSVPPPTGSRRGRPTRQGCPVPYFARVRPRHWSQGIPRAPCHHSKPLLSTLCRDTGVPRWTRCAPRTLQPWGNVLVNSPPALLTPGPEWGPQHGGLEDSPWTGAHSQPGCVMLGWPEGNTPNKSGVSSTDKGWPGSRCACGRGRRQQLLPARRWGGEGQPWRVGQQPGKLLLGGTAAERAHCLPTPAQAWWTLP